MNLFYLFKHLLFLLWSIHFAFGQNEDKKSFLLVPLENVNLSSIGFIESFNATENFKRNSYNSDLNVILKTTDHTKDNSIIKNVQECATCTCGIPNRRRIIGGTRVRTNKYPWIAQLRYYGRFYCGGSLINDRYILTAAHCTKGFQQEHITVKLLQYDQSSRMGIERNVSMIIRPDSYSTQTLDNDISLIRLSEPVPIQGNIRPICLPSSGESYTDKIAVVAGWGARFQNGGPSNILYELDVPIISNERCKRTVYKNRITPTMLCAGYLAGGKDACQGDSGGPLIVSNGLNYEQVGIVSWGYGCARRNSPGVYTRVTKYLQWITYHTTDACYCKHS